MKTETAGAGLPLSRVRVIADARHHLPAVAAVAAAEEARRFDASPDLVLLGPELERPYVGGGGAVSFRKGRRRLRLLPGFSQVGGLEHLHAEEGIAARRIEDGLGSPSVHQRRVDRSEEHTSELQSPYVISYA